MLYYRNGKVDFCVRRRQSARARVTLAKHWRRQCRRVFRVPENKNNDKKIKIKKSTTGVVPRRDGGGSRSRRRHRRRRHVRRSCIQQRRKFRVTRPPASINTINYYNIYNIW